MAAPRINWSTLWDKVSHFLVQTFAPEHPSSWITGGCQSPYWTSIGTAGTWTRVFRLHDRRSTNWATDHAGRNEWNNLDWWLPSFTANMAIKPTNLASQYMMHGRIHNNYKGRWQHPDLTGQRFGTKSVTYQFKHLLSSTPEHPSSWITGGCPSPLLAKYWRGRDLNPGLLFTWQTLYQLSYWPRWQKWVK